MFVILGSFASVSVGLWLAFASLLKPACAGRPGRATPKLAVAGAG